MLRNKRILFILAVAVALFLIPSICNAATIDATETTTTSTGSTIKWSYELDDENNAIKLKCINKTTAEGNLVIPSTIDGYTVISIEKDCFKECVGLSSITISSTIKEIGDYAFDGCSGISSITFGENLVSIGNYAFRNCTGLTQIQLPSKLRTIGSNAFNGCTGITSLTIPDSVMKMDTRAFCNCSGITQLTISKNLTKLDKGVFAGCKGLTSVIVPDKVTTICGYQYNWYHDGAFDGCINLEKILIPDTVATIEQNVFYECPQKLTIFGNDGKASKKYATDNNINFDYISNWDKVGIGDDITPPIIKTLKIEYSSMFQYDEGTTYYLASEGTKIQIKATFEEPVYGNTAPTLTIKCGNGSDIALTNGVIQGSYIIYTYEIKDNDKGLISAVSMTGGDIADAVGNIVETYSCPELTTTNIYGKNFVFANGTGSTPNNQNPSTTVTLSSISITKAPIKTSYVEGASFDKTGMVVTATYSDNTTKQITNYTISSGALKVADKQVIISYTENGITKTVGQKITVTAKSTGSGAGTGNGNGSGTTTGTGSGADKDTTIKGDNKLPQTGATVLTIALISLTAVAVISKVKIGKYKDI